MSAIIRREPFPEAWEGYALAGGEYVVALSEPAVLTDKGRLPAPDALRFPVMTVGTPRGRCIAGQAQNSRSTWEWVEIDQEWYDRGLNQGLRPCVYLPDGQLHIQREEPNVPVEGWAGVDAQGRPQYIAQSALGMNEVTVVGPFAIGQNRIDGIELQYGGVRYQLEPGDVRTIWAVLSGDVLAVATRKIRDRETVLLWAAVNRIAELPPAPVKQPDKPKEPDTPKEPDPKEPTVPAFPFPDGYDPRPALNAVRAQFPTPLGERHAEFLVKAARAVGHGAGLLKKDGGTRILLPNGIGVSQDWMVFPNGSGADFLGDGEGAATIGWGEAQANPGTLVPVDGLFVDDPGGDPGGDPDPQPDTDLAKQVQALAATMLEHSSRLSAVERVVDGYGGQLTAGAARDANMADRIAALEKGGTGTGGGTPIPADLAKQIAAELLKLFGKLAA